jgi:phage tail-like protein
MSALVPAPTTYPQGWMAGQLPVGLREDDFFLRFTMIFERLAGTLRSGADNVQFVSDSAVTPLEVLGYLGRWMGVDLVDSRLDPEVQREIVAALGRTLTRRGTAGALKEMLEAVTGGRVTVIDPGAVIGDEELPIQRPVEVLVSDCGHLRPHEVEAIVRDEVPAHIPVNVRISGVAA